MTPLLQHGVTAQAETRPGATAIVWRGERISYGTLEAESNRLAQLLVDAGCGRGDRVALLMPKLPAAIVAMLGVLKTDAAYVPLDPGDPTARLARTLAAADCRWIICAGPVTDVLHEVLATADIDEQPLIGWLEDAPATDGPRVHFKHSDLAAFPAEPPATANTDGDLAHILFTSGSTGVPKGVMITHGGVIHFIQWARRYFGIGSTDRVSQHPPLRFDVATFDVFGTLWSGAELHLVPPTLNVLPDKLAHFIRDRQLTQWFSVPSVLNLMAKFDVLEEHDFPELKRVLFAGEVLPTPTLMYWMRRLPHVRFTNLYGPTETTISSSYHTITRCPASEFEPIPIGAACAGEELLLLDEHLEPVADSKIGEIYIRGAGVSRGYWRDPQRTRAAFLADPAGGGRIYKTGDRAWRNADGLLYFCGRADTQIKSRGYRIELGEIESALNCLRELRESAVLAIESHGFEGSLVCCAYAPMPGADVSPRRLRALLRAELPAYMVPARWLRYDELPKNGNGKTDRPVLREAFRALETSRGRAKAHGANGSAPARHRSRGQTKVATQSEGSH